jgi:exopolysaccharide biosynthesis polyprenyl glycosylphosphotransferase
MKPLFATHQIIPGNEIREDPDNLLGRLSQKAQRRLFLLALVASDLVFLFLAFNLAYTIRFELALPFFRLDVLPSGHYYNAISVLFVGLWITVFALSGLYNWKNLLGGIDEYAILFRSTLIGLLILIFASFLEPAFIIARGWLLLSWWFSFLFPAIGRFILRRIIYGFRRAGYFMSPALIVGANDEGLSLARQLVNWQSSGLKVVGFLDKKIKPGTPLIGNIQVLGTVDQIEEIIDQHNIEELILARSAISTHEKLLDIFKLYGFSNKVNLRMSSGLYEILTTGLTVKEFAYVPMVCVNKVRLTGGEQLVKTILDYFVTVIGLVIVSPLLAIIAIAIKLDSPGPIIYRRRVMGVNSTQFDAFKFRTMRVDGDEILASHPDLVEELAKNQKIKDDPRVTCMGKFLRKFSLDELPQAINVLRREMSLIGPRMISPEELVNYNHWGLNLLTIRPGLTGLWQVSGRSDLTYEERVRMDMHYIRNWSIWLDIQILIRTIPVVLLGKGAY